MINDNKKYFLLNYLITKLIKIYRQAISPLLPPRCRYYPTCSQYGLQAIAWHGSIKGSWLLIKRICRCHPFGGHGTDFVPLPLYQFKFIYQGCKNSVLMHDNSNYVFIDKFGYNNQLNYWIKSLKL